jgi:hypothetical protein
VSGILLCVSHFIPCQQFYVVSVISFMAAISCYLNHFQVVSVIFIMCQSFYDMLAISYCASHSFFFVSHFLYFVSAILGFVSHFISFSAILYILNQPFFVVSGISCCVSHSIFCQSFYIFCIILCVLPILCSTSHFNMYHFSFKPFDSHQISHFLYMLLCYLITKSFECIRCIFSLRRYRIL